LGAADVDWGALIVVLSSICWVGGTIIFASTAYIAYREATLRRGRE
jgi:hypothetical protein